MNNAVDGQEREGPKPARERNQLYLWDTRLVYASRGYVSQEHSHFAATLIVSLRDSFSVSIGGGASARCDAILVKPNCRFSIHAPRSEVLIFNQDPDTAGYQALEECLEGRDHRMLAPRQLSAHRDAFEALMEGAPTYEEAAAVFETVLASLGPRASAELDAPPELDPRVGEVARTLRSRCPATARVPELADVVQTSSDRLMRLFREQMGLPIRQYLLWLKLRRAIGMLQRGSNLAHIAQDAGFYDSAHLVRTAARMYGVRLSGFNDTRFVQVHHAAACHHRPAVR